MIHQLRWSLVHGRWGYQRVLNSCINDIEYNIFNTIPKEGWAVAWLKIYILEKYNACGRGELIVKHSRSPFSLFHFACILNDLAVSLWPDRSVNAFSINISISAHPLTHAGVRKKHIIKRECLPCITTVYVYIYFVFLYA